MDLKEAMEYIVKIGRETAEPVVREINGHTYCNKELVRYDREQKAEPIKASSLTALVDYLSDNKSELSEHMIIHVVSPTNVKLISCLTPDRNRECLFECNAETSQFRNDSYYDQERFIIELQANFLVTDDLVTILKVAGNVEANSTASYGDDGISQRTTIKQGIASKADVLVPNPVTLSPYRTFLEVEQPASQFVFRISEDKGEPRFKLIEAEGGLWKYVAKKNIKECLEERIPAELKGRITVIA